MLVKVIGESLMCIVFVLVIVVGYVRGYGWVVDWSELIIPLLVWV